MKRGSFIIDGINSEDLKALIQYRPLIEAPLRKVNWKGAYGVDGDIPFDEGAYNNTNMELIFVIDGNDVYPDRQTFYDAFDSAGFYKEFIPYFDPDKIYRVMLSDKISFENNYMYGEKQSAKVTLTVKPYKYLVNNNSVTLSGNTGVITNPTKCTSLPTFKITGTGAVVLNVNGVPFNIKNVADSITINGERQVAYKEIATGVIDNMNHQITTRDYPIFKPGVNNISVTGNVTKIEIIPRWRSLV